MEPLFLSAEDRNALADLLFQSGPNAIRILNKTVSITKATAGLNCSSVTKDSYPQSVLTEIISCLEQGPMYSEISESPPLGYLLQQLVEVPEKHNQLMQRFSARLLVKYGLATDPSYLQSLRYRFGIGHHSNQAISKSAFAPQITRKILQPIGSEDPDRYPEWSTIQDLEAARYLGKTVGRIEGKKKGSGFLIGPDLLITNFHVFKPRIIDEFSEIKLEDTDGCQVYFEYMDALLSTTAHTRPIYEITAVETSSNLLDYTIVRLTGRPLASFPFGDPSHHTHLQLNKSGKHQGFVGLNAFDEAEKGGRAHIIQYPGGDSLVFAMNRNQVRLVTNSRIYYTTDTKSGSSGSPVFNSRWRLIGLHRDSTQVDRTNISLQTQLREADLPPTEVSKQGQMIRYQSNEAVPIRAIVEDLNRKGLNGLIR